MAEPLQVGLDNLQAAKDSSKTGKRVGRGVGSGSGKTAGRGVKGQKSRSGGGVRRGFEGGQTPLQRRLPKYGFNPPFRKVYEVVNLSALESRFEKGETVNPESLLAKGLIKSLKCLVKILGDGNLSKDLKVHAHKFSKTATQKINQAGGSVEEIKLGSG